MSALLEEVQSTADAAAKLKAEHRAAASKDYIALLGRCESPKPGDAKKLPEILEALDLTLDDFAQAVAIKKRIDTHRAAIPSAEQLADLQSKVRPAEQTYREAKKAFEAAQLAWRVACNQSESAHNRAGDQLLAAQDLEHKHAGLLAPPEAEPVPAAEPVETNGPRYEQRAWQARST
jgi:hypothetical protein